METNEWVYIAQTLAFLVFEFEHDSTCEYPREYIYPREATQ